MTNIFANKKVANKTEVEEDRLVGGGVMSTDIYPGTIKYAYLGKAQNSDARSVTIGIKFDNGKELSRTVWLTNRNGNVTYTDKKTKEEHNLPGYNQINGLCMLLLSKELGDLDVEEKTLSLWDYESRKEIPQSVQCFVELHGQKLNVAIQEQIIDKTSKNDQTGEYEPNGETVNVNEFVKFFAADKLVTLSEVSFFIKSLGGTFEDVLSDGDLQKAIDKMEDESGDFAQKWLEKNRGEVWDRSTANKGNNKGKEFKKSSSSGSSEGKAKSLFDD